MAVFVGTEKDKLEDSNTPMNNDVKFDPKLLRPVKYICEPDPRQRHFAKIDHEIKGFRPITLDDYHESVSQISLNVSVPKEVIIQFETAKNLYLYAWFIYRFYPVAEHQAFACLELALRTRYGKEISKSYFMRSKKSEAKGKPKPKEPSLSSLLRYAIEKGDMKNEGFRKWREAVER